MQDKTGEGPGVSRVGRVGIAVVTAYLLGLSAALLYCLIILWPHPAASQAGSPGQTKAEFQKVADTSLDPNTSPFGFMALSAMVGMFSEQAVLKLKEIAETLLSKPPVGKDAEPQSLG